MPEENLLLRNPFLKNLHTAIRNGDDQARDCPRGGHWAKSSLLHTTDLPARRGEIILPTV
jgi:hypothetical protein